MWALDGWVCQRCRQARSHLWRRRHHKQPDPLGRLTDYMLAAAAPSLGALCPLCASVIIIAAMCAHVDACRHKRGGKKGALRAVSFAFSPRGCAARVNPQLVPQLQLHMLATGCQSVLLASRCAERGLRVWRLWRDDAWLKSALELLSQLQVQHVARNAAPPANFFSRQPGHAAFLRRTLSIARGAECIADAGEEAVACVPPTAINQAKFW